MTRAPVRPERSAMWANQAVLIGLALSIGLALALLPLASLQLLGAGALGLALVVLILAEPALGIALTLLAGPFGPLEREVLHVLPLDSAQILFGLTLFAYVLRGLYTRWGWVRARAVKQAAPPRLSVIIALGIFLAGVALSFFQSRSFTDWAEEALKWVELLTLCVLVGFERDRRKLFLVIGAVLASAALQGGLGMWQSYRGYGPPVFLVPGTNTYRSYGTFQQPNPFGGYMGLVWPFCAGVALTLLGKASPAHRSWRWALVAGAAAAAIAAALALTGVFTSGSRGARLAAGAALVAMGLAMLRKPGWWLALFAFIALAAIAFNQVPGSITNVINGLITDYGSLDVRGVYLTALNFSNVERIAHWQAALAMMRDYPWLGIGFGNYDVYYPQYRLLYWENALGHAHNYYLNIFAETGVIGFVAYLGLWSIILAETVRRIRQSKRRVTPFLIFNSPLLTFYFPLSPLYIGLLGTWAHLTVHHLFDNLYVANSFLLLGVLLGLLVNQNLFEADAPLVDGAPPTADG